MGATYQRTHKALQRMCDHEHPTTGKRVIGIVERQRDAHVGEAHLYWLKESKLKWPERWQNREHEKACADLFVAYYPHLSWWDSEWTQFERDQHVERWKVLYDRRMVLGGRVFLWELDRCTEPIYSEKDRDRYEPKRWLKSLNGKIDKYVAFARANPKTWFYVVFATQAGKFGSAGKRANDIIELLTERGLTRGQFLVSTHERICQDPMGPVFAVPGKVARMTALLDV